MTDTYPLPPPPSTEITQPTTTTMPRLPDTGINADPWVAAGLWLIVLGAALVIAVQYMMHRARR